MIGQAPAANKVLTGPLLAGTLVIAGIAVMAPHLMLVPACMKSPKFCAAVPGKYRTGRRSRVITLRSEPLSGMPGKRVTVQLVPGASVHGQPCTAVR
jgi:hypothetical protein